MEAQDHILAAGDQGLYAGVTFGSLFVKALARRPETVAFVWNDQRMTYRELAQQISRSVQVFTDLGLKRGDTVAHLSLNSPEAIITWASCGLLGLRYTPLHPLGTPETDAFVLNKAKVCTVVLDAAHFNHRAEQILNGANGVQHILALNLTGTGLDYENLRQQKEPAPLTVTATVEDVIAIFFTGGTTGEPKGVMHSSRTLVANAMISSAEWEWPQNINMLLATPVSHAAGYMVLPILLRGGTVHLQDGFSPDKFLEAVANKQINATFMVPTMIYATLDSPKAKETDFSHLEFVLYGAAPMSPTRLVEAIEVFGRVFTQGYAQTEAPNSAVALYRDAHQGERLKSCGMPLAGITVSILDTECKEVAVGESGEICFRGPLVMDGYLDNPEETEKAFRGGWLHTGDVGYRDVDGYIYIVDRLKDMIISGGFNVYPKEVEDAISKHPAIGDVAVVGLPDDRWGEVVVAAVNLRPGHDVDEASLIEMVKKEKGAVYAPKKVLFHDTPLPKTPLEKPDKKELRHLLA
tara:strand:+ start:146 stop:1711 length:1566 start_codon:yes stop_codon:yes gene_type:complete